MTLDDSTMIESIKNKCANRFYVLSYLYMYYTCVNNGDRERERIFFFFRHADEVRFHDVFSIEKIIMHRKKK